MNSCSLSKNNISLEFMSCCHSNIVILPPLPATVLCHSACSEMTFDEVSQELQIFLSHLESLQSDIARQLTDMDAVSDRLSVHCLSSTIDCRCWEK